MGLKPARAFLPEARRRAVRIWVIGVYIAAKLLERSDFAVRGPADERKTVEFFHPSVQHLVFEAPFDCGMVFRMEKPEDIPDQHPEYWTDTAAAWNLTA